MLQTQAIAMETQHGSLNLWLLHTGGDDSENKINKQTNQGTLTPGEIRREIKTLSYCEH